MGGRSIHYCGACGEELFDDMECPKCNPEGGPMSLITSLEDERLDIKKNPSYPASITGVRQAIDDVMVLRDSTRAALTALDRERERVCRVREIAFDTKYAPCKACLGIQAALSSSAPCECGEKVKRLESIPKDGLFHHRLSVDGGFGAIERIEICRLLIEHIGGKPIVDRTEAPAAARKGE